MRILAISRIDCAAAGYYLSRAINQCTSHESRMVRLKKRNIYRFPTDVVQPSDQRLRTLWDWADVIHIHDFAWPMPHDLGPGQKPTVVTYHGTAYRTRFAKHDRAAKELGWIRTVSTIDLTLKSGALWLPDTRVNMGKFKPKPAPGFRVIHAPTNRGVKDTLSVIHILTLLKARGIAFDLIEDTPFHECLVRKAQGHLLIDQFILGYGCNAIEAWALGLVVLANATDEILTAIDSEIGYIPFVRCELADLKMAILRLRDEPQFYKEAQERGQQFWHDYHAPDKVAARAIGLYQRALARHKDPPAPAKPNLVRIRYVEKHSGVQTFWGPKTNKAYEFGGPQRVGEVDERDLATGISTNPGFLEMAGRGGKRLFRRVKVKDG